MTEPTQGSDGAAIEVDPLSKELGERFTAGGSEL